MEKVLTTNNGQANWAKLSTFGLHSRKSHIGFNRYAGKHGAIYLVDQTSGMKVLFQAGQKPRSERESYSFKAFGRRGRPAIVGCKQQKEPQKRGRKPLTAEQKAEREALKAELASLVFFGPVRKRGPKVGSVRVSEADRVKAGKKGEVIEAKGGSWLMIADGVGSWIAA